ncbi:SWI/SNF-related matrix-associated actin-dependent regulator of chromatin subfamily A containing DEAD/H box 1A-like isoform X2 [Halichondria panicea]|uniref:SWI/SNF-related matrix-associated actin-dependent regulator of chromatin subfamily A containing DEAD/H box 1A-like isoform X2 n=1 Tax=Halichondria panicea TaxID=6063 RepID=UPI00312B7306
MFICSFLVYSSQFLLLCSPHPHPHTLHTPQRVDESSSYYQKQVRQAKQIMTPFTLQRLQSQVPSQLSTKVSSTKYCQLTETQWRGVMKRSFRVNKGRHGVRRPWMLMSSTIQEDGRDVMVDLHKATNHPLLLRHYYTDDTLHCMDDCVVFSHSQRCSTFFCCVSMVIQLHQPTPVMSLFSAPRKSS